MRRLWTSIFHLVADGLYQGGRGDIQQLFFEVEERLMDTKVE